MLFPALSGPYWRSTLTANLTANVVRNLWSHSVIMCGHFPEGVETFEQEALDEQETKGEWYLRQMLGSANISGSKAMHLMSGNLSHQIEHHLFPDLPSNRYYEIAPKVRDLFHRYGLSYNARPLPEAGGERLAQGGAPLPPQRLAGGDAARRTPRSRSRSCSAPSRSARWSAKGSGLRLSSPPRSDLAWALGCAESLTSVG